MLEIKSKLQINQKLQLMIKVALVF